MPEDRRLAAIMPARPEWNASLSASLWRPKEGGPACPCVGQAPAGRFTDIVGYTALMWVEMGNEIKCTSTSDFVEMLRGAERKELIQWINLVRSQIAGKRKFFKLIKLLHSI